MSRNGWLILWNPQYMALFGKVKRMESIKRTVLINNFRNGDLNMVDIRSKIASLKANVVKRFFENQSDTLWKECFTQHLNYFGGKLFFQCDYDVKYLGTEIPAYYLHVLECWKHFYSKEILDETIQSCHLVSFGTTVTFKSKKNPYFGKIFMRFV